MKEKIIKEICNNLNVTLNNQDMAELSKYFYSAQHKLFDDKGEYATLTFIGERKGWNCFILPTDCFLINKVYPRICYKIEGNKFYTPNTNYVRLEYISKYNQSVKIFKRFLQKKIKKILTMVGK